MLSLFCLLSLCCHLTSSSICVLVSLFIEVPYAVGNYMLKPHCQVAIQHIAKHYSKFIKISSWALCQSCGEWVCSWEISELDEVYATCWAALGPRPAASCFSAGSCRWRQKRQLCVGLLNSLSRVLSVSLYLFFLPSMSSSQTGWVQIFSVWLNPALLTVRVNNKKICSSSASICLSVCLVFCRFI